MSVLVNLYNGIYRVLANDPTVLSYLGVSGGDNLAKAKRIQKRHKPQNLADNMPLICFYAPPGRRNMEQNHLVYETNFAFDIYTKDDVDRALRIADRIEELFDGEIPPFMGVEVFESYFSKGHETPSDLANSYCFSIVVYFAVSLDH